MPWLPSRQLGLLGCGAALGFIFLMVDQMLMMMSSTVKWWMGLVVLTVKWASADIRRIQNNSVSPRNYRHHIRDTPVVRPWPGQ